MLSLLPYQEEGVAFLRSRDYALLADDPGLGKTAQVLMALEPGAPVLVVCPKVAKGVWKAEAEKWRSGVWKVVTPASRSKFKLPQAGEMVVSTYDSLPSFSLLDEVAPGTVVVADEAHLVKAGSNKRCNAFRSLAIRITESRGRLWMMTGTPMPNQPLELWNLLSYTPMARNAYGSKTGFLSAFNGSVIRTKYGVEYRWGKPTPAAREGLRKVAMRRRRAEVLPQMPRKFYRTVYCELPAQVTSMCEELTQVMERNRMSFDDLVELVWGGRESFEGFSLPELRKALAMAKIAPLLEHVEEAEEQGEPLVVFSAHRAPLEVLQEREGWRIITGATSSVQRQKIAEEFQAGVLKGVGASIKAAGVAITLTKAHQCLFVDRDWTPANNSQAEARLQRIGQEQNVLVTNLVCDHAVDSHVTRVLMTKQRLIEEVTE
jgi:SWI/SNF-related matrix-associated actin-dependent regulator of chromatin subfamily A-like protein 1